MTYPRHSLNLTVPCCNYTPGSWQHSVVLWTHAKPCNLNSGTQAATPNSSNGALESLSPKPLTLIPKPTRNPLRPARARGATESPKTDLHPTTGFFSCKDRAFVWWFGRLGFGVRGTWRFRALSVGWGVGSQNSLRI